MAAILKEIPRIQNKQPSKKMKFCPAWSFDPVKTPLRTNKQQDQKKIFR